MANAFVLPVKAAQAIIEAVNNGSPSFRRPLTAGTIDTIKAKLLHYKAALHKQKR
ncbi:hypothetical protein SAMN04488128_101203 [Chitinophaga eiseniae]|uniref:Uncharacterized protein n=1 Tax=Chitinophaga eiseniae TaxID=634771 RepID=A0A1T4KLX0_9BACT|nr:hypothetical protein [Chitinophaga eiseniae]SJZ43399.1 hypothetical protein SAMN04488128_101203 [Chitinophaga eiseniae]